MSLLVRSVSGRTGPAAPGPHQSGFFAARGGAWFSNFWSCSVQVNEGNNVPHYIGSDISLATMKYVLELLDAEAGR